MKLTENELLEALRDATKRVGPNPDNAYSIQELADALEWSRIRVRNELVRLKASGRLEVVRVKREDLRGFNVPVYLYRIIGDKRKRAG